MNQQWELYCDGELVAYIHQESFDQPWFYGKLIWLDRFLSLQELFRAAKDFIDAEDFDSQASQAVFEAINQYKLSLKYVSDGAQFDEVLLMMYGDHVGWRI